MQIIGLYIIKILYLPGINFEKGSLNAKRIF